MESKLRSAEGDKQNFVMAVQMDNGDIDKLNLRKAELQIMKLRAELAEKEIVVMETEMQLKNQKAQAAEGDKDLTNAHTEAAVLTVKLGKKEASLEELKTAYKVKYGESVDGLSEAAASVYAKQIADLESKIEQLMPLYWVGHATRNRYVEGENKMIRGHGNVERDTETKSIEAWKFGKILSDATLFLSFDDNNRESLDEFETIYGVKPAVAWENRAFESLMNVLR